MQDRFYFRQLLSGQDFAVGDPLATQMVNFVYVIGDKVTKEALIVDPAYDVDGIIATLEADDMEVAGVLATHYHPDHVGGSMMGYDINGIAEVLAHKDVPIHVQAAEAEFVTKVTQVGGDHLVSHESGDKVTVGEIEVELIHTPGHTPGSQCFLVHDCLVSGDTLFLDGCGRTDLPGGDPEELYKSLTKRLSVVPDHATLFPGHLYSPPETDRSMGETRNRNIVYKPKSAEQWLMMFGR
jgi:hydroxyacylglutathione hydrolase